MKTLPPQSEAQIIATILEHPDVTSCEVIELLKDAVVNMVLKARVNGQDVVIKVFHNIERGNRVSNLQAELGFLEKTMSSGPYQVNRCLFAFPEHGIVVLSFAKGKPVNHALNNANPTERYELMKQCGKWLQFYTRERQSVGRLGTKKWIEIAKSLKTDHISDANDKRLLERLLASLESQAKHIHGCRVLRASTHGDFASPNLHYSQGVLTGVDIQSELRVAIANDIAQFLVFTQIHNDSILYESKYGIMKQDWDAFLEDGILDIKEQETTLPFFIGCKMYGRYINGYRRKRARRNLDHAIECYLAEPAFEIDS